MTIMVRGKVYVSATECAKKLKVSKQAVYNAMYRGTLETLGVGRGSSGAYGGGRPPIPFKLGKVEFKSQAEASRQLGKNPMYVTNVLRHGKVTARARLVRLIMEYEAKQSRKD
jgi:hypothetical protein